MNKLLSSKSINDTTKKLIPLYAATFCIPFVILFTLAVFYQSGYGTPFTGILSLSHNLLNGLAALSFLYFIRHTVSIGLTDTRIQLVSAVTYGLCSYGILQEQTPSVLLIYALFPLFYLSYEKMLHSSNKLPFCVFCSCMLIINPACAIPVTLLLFVLTFFKLSINHECSFGNILKIFCCFLFPYALSAFRLLPYLWNAYSNGSYDGCHFSYTPAVLVAKLLPFCASSVSLASLNGFDLYFGIFMLIFSISFYFNHKTPFRERLNYGIYTILLIAALEFSPLQFIFNLFVNTETVSVSYSFLFVFWCLMIACESISLTMKYHQKSVLLSGTIITGLVILWSFVGSAHNFHAIALPTILFIFVLIIVTFYMPTRSASFSKYQITILCSYVFIELFCNAFIATNQDFTNPNCDIRSFYIWNQSTQEASDEASTDDPSADHYKTFLSEHTDTTLISCLNQLLSSVSLTEEEYDTYCNTDFPDQIEQINGLCRKIGAKSDLFTQVDVPVLFDKSDEYLITLLSDGIYSCSVFDNETDDNIIIYPSFHLGKTDVEYDNLYLFENCTSSFYKISDLSANSKQSGYLGLSIAKDCYLNFKITLVTLDSDLYARIPDLLVAYLSAQNSNSSLHFSYILGLAISVLFFFFALLLYLCKDKPLFLEKCTSLFSAISNWSLPHKLCQHLRKNKVYYVSFLLPVILYVLTMVVYNCVPFGTNSFFDEDGTSLTLPTYLDYYYSFSDGNTYLTMNNAYGAGNYAANPLLPLLYFYKFLSVSTIAPLLLLSEGVCLGLCSLFMAIYMTHRQKYTAASTLDWRILIPSLVYALNAYMLRMHSFCSWYFILLALPLLIFAFDKLMYQKKNLAYVLLLTYCIAINLYLALYICIFLVILFFTYHFDNIKDFIRKGCRFAFFSILSAGNAFFVIAATLIGSSDSLYQEADSLFPSFGFHTSFWNQWQKHMICIPTQAVSGEEGYISLYCGILTLLLVLIYFMSKLSFTQKMKRLIPILILYFSFNEQILTYIWNGFHYQSKVPNRYVFLLMFLLAELAYDGLLQLQKISFKKVTIASILLICFFIGCNCLSSEPDYSVAFVATLVLCIMYYLIYTIVRVILHKENLYIPLLISLFIIELSVNLFYVTNDYGYSTIQVYGDYTDISDKIETHLTNTKDSFVRINYPTNLVPNNGSIYHSGSNSIFNSFVSEHQTNTGALYGFHIGSNIINNSYNSTPLTLSLSGTKYIFIPMVGSSVIEDLEQYTYIGELDQYYYIYENTSSLSLGFYVPEEALSIASELSYIPDFYNSFTSIFTGNDDKVFVSHYLQYDETGKKENSFYFTDNKGNIISYEEAIELYKKEEVDKSLSPFNSILLHLNCKPDTEGVLYFYPGEFVALGSAQKNESAHFVIKLPDSSLGIRKDYNYVVYDSAAFESFYDAASKNQLENVTIQNDTIQGTTNYEQDGYTMLSIAYDPGWHAYIDGVEVEITDAYNASIFVKTPAGSHTLTLKYIPYGMKETKLITLVFWIFTVSFFFLQYMRAKKRKAVTNL